jgi:hypothetical protein
VFRRKAPPDWAPFADAADWRAFEAVVRADVHPRGWSGEVRDGLLTDGTGKFFLDNLARMCVAEPRAAWPELIRRHFDLCASADDLTVLDNRGEARVALRARLVPFDFLAIVDYDYVSRRVADDLMVVLAFDLPDRVVISQREEVLQWGDEEELFELALEQTKTERGLELHLHARAVGGGVRPARVRARHARLGPEPPRGARPPDPRQQRLRRDQPDAAAHTRPRAQRPGLDLVEPVLAARR